VHLSHALNRTISSIFSSGENLVSKSGSRPAAQVVSNRKQSREVLVDLDGFEPSTSSMPWKRKGHHLAASSLKTKHLLVRVVRPRCGIRKDSAGIVREGNDRLDRGDSLPAPALASVIGSNLLLVT
jgi:hypothetical protein